MMILLGSDKKKEDGLIRGSSKLHLRHLNDELSLSALLVGNTVSLHA